MSPPTNQSPACVRVSALTGGHLTLPEYLFVTDADASKRTLVPSMCFLIERRDPTQDGKITRIVWDLGLKRDLSAYEPAMQIHIANRQPIVTDPDVAQCLRNGGLDPTKDIDIVMYSHVHWDHVGTPSDFPNSTFIVGSGTLDLLARGAPPHYPANIFDSKMLDESRTKELPCAHEADEIYARKELQTDHEWKPAFGFPAVIDFFGDESVLIVDSPGHLRGHINVLLRIDKDRRVYLGGDCCHDIRILEGTKDIALYDDGHGQLRSVHMDTETARKTIAQIKECLSESSELRKQNTKVEVVVAHDGSWMRRNPHCFFPGCI